MFIKRSQSTFFEWSRASCRKPWLLCVAVYRWRARCQPRFSLSVAGRQGLASHSPSNSSARVSCNSRSAMSAERAARWQLMSPSQVVSASDRNTRSQVVGGASPCIALFYEISGNRAKTLVPMFSINYEIVTYAKIAYLMETAEWQEQLSTVSGQKINILAPLDKFGQYWTRPSCACCNRMFMFYFLFYSSEQEKHTMSY